MPFFSFFFFALRGRIYHGGRRDIVLTKCYINCHLDMHTSQPEYPEAFEIHHTRDSHLKIEMLTNTAAALSFLPCQVLHHPGKVDMLLWACPPRLCPTVGVEQTTFTVHAFVSILCPCV